MRQIRPLSLFLLGCWLGCGGTPVVEPGLQGMEPGASDSGNGAVVELSLDRGTISSELDRCDPIDEEGRFFERYGIGLVEGQWVRIWAVSVIVDPMLQVTGPGGFILESDDLLPGTLIPVVEFETPSTGTYTIRVSGYQVGQEGAYTLGMLPIHPSPPVERLVSGQMFEVSTHAGGAGPGLRTGDNHWIEVHQGERLYFRLTSIAFDTVAILFGPDGQVWINDDANDVGEDGTERPLDSTLVVFAPRSGLYHFLAASYGDTGGGTYRLRIQVRDPVILREGEAVPSVGFAGPEGTGRIYGLFVGISAYLTMGNLYGCGDDARFLAQAFRERGLQSAEQQIVLTDDSATRTAFLQTLQTMTAKAGPDDVLVVFFSGHGNNQPATPGDAEEIDGSDESIVLVDGEVTDNELASLLRAANAGLVLVALDSCHSGGFARDLGSLPGVVGLFSSDEDILSDTAEPLGAGGYLSYYLRRGVLGEADSKPTDGSLQVGELTDYIYRGFIESHDKMNPPGSNDPLQRLVIQRGSVLWEELLWLYPRQPDGSLPPVPDLPLRSPEPQPEPVLERPVTCGP